MIPGRFDIELYDGDYYRGPLIVLPDLTPFGGPSDLSAATVTAQIRERAGSEEGFAFTVEPVAPLLRELRLTLTKTQVLDLPKSGAWDLQVEQGDFTGTVLAGYVEKTRQVTR